MTEWPTSPDSRASRDARPRHCEACGQPAKNTLTGTFGTLCAACVERISGQTLDQLADLDPNQPIRALTPQEEQAILDASLAPMRAAQAHLLHRQPNRQPPEAIR